MASHIYRRHSWTILPTPSANLPGQSLSSPASITLPTSTATNEATTNPNDNSHAQFTTFTTSYPLTVHDSLSWSKSLTISPYFNSEPTSVGDMRNVCAGNGLDAAAQGILAAFILPTVIGLAIWLIFSMVRPRFRQVYALREWFLQPDLRPKHLNSSLFAFLFPHVPLVPAVPTDVSDAGKSIEDDAELFPSDEQLSQRALWVSLLIVLGWSLIGLGGALPLYLVDTPCVAQSTFLSSGVGGFSTLQDLSLLRLLKMLDNNEIAPASNLSLHLATRATVDGQDVSWKARLRVIILAALVVSLGVAPALWKILKEFNRLVAYRKRFTDVRCQEIEIGWLSVCKTPGFAGWGERRLKEFIMTTGLSGSLDGNNAIAASRNHISDRRSRMTEEGRAEVDVQSLFTIGDTHKLAILIDERDEILENLEVAEAKYVSSFRLKTPDPSVIDFAQHAQQQPETGRPLISRPLPLNGHRKPRRKRSMNPAFAASSHAPTNFVAPSQYYKLHNIRGVNNGRFAGSFGHNSQASFSDAFNSRVIGSRFQEVNRNSLAFGRLPYGSFVRVEKGGQLGPRESMAMTDAYQNIPDPRHYGPNHEAEPLDETAEEWVDVVHGAGEFGEIASEQNGGAPSSFRRPFKIRAPSSRRETFPLRGRDTQGESSPDDVLPPHLRLQHSAPFVRPLSGVDFDGLGDVYAQIRLWRSQLKLINNEIAEAQNEGYREIAEGVNVKGWLMIGRGLRYIHGVEIIEGRAKEDIRWDVLQNERDKFDSLIVWAIVVVTGILLTAGLTAASGLALSGAPDFGQYVPFLRNLGSREDLAGGLATVLAPSVGAVLFTSVALWIVRWVTTLHGSASISGSQLLVFKSTFAILVLVAGIWLVIVGAFIFPLGAYDHKSSETASIAEGAIYIAVLVLAMILNVALIVPGLLLLQPRRLLRVLKSEKTAVTPRQRFRAVYPRNYDPSYATAACITAIVFASAFAVVFPLIAPAVVVLILLTLVAHRYLIGYVYGRTHSQSGGVLQIWLFKRFGTLIALQPLLLGLLLLSRRLWEEAGVLIGTAIFVTIFVEVYCGSKTRQPKVTSLSGITQDCLEHFMLKAQNKRFEGEGSDGQQSLMSDAVSGTNRVRSRGSFASVLEMMSLTLAVMPSPSKSRGPVPLQTETLNDLTATERAARTHPDAPPHLPPLPFTDHAEEMAGILYAPELIAPPPIIWLPNDAAGVAQSEATDLERYHDLKCTLDVRSQDDITQRERTLSTRSNRR